jgi:TonB family protein
VGATADLGIIREELRGAGPLGSAGGNPIPLEVCVNATGARLGQGTEKRELFSEDTRTILVLPDAAVISLSAEVTPGQLIFLTNKSNGREVVCQVIRKTCSRPTSCYVELQFTEPQTDFWGVVFPEKPAEAATEPQRIQEEKNLVSTKAAEAHAAPVEEPDAEEVQFLKQEVDALREQLIALTEAKKKEEEAAAAETAKREAAAKPLIKMNLPAAPAGAEAPTSTPARLIEPATLTPPKPVPTEPPGKVQSPAARSAERDAFEDLLPRPELDFSSAPIPGGRPEDDDPYSIYKPLRKDVGIKGAVVTIATVLLLTLGSGLVWYKDLLPIVWRKPTSPAARAKTGPLGNSSPVANAQMKSSGESVPTVVGAASQQASDTGGLDGGAAGGPAPVLRGQTTATIAERTTPGNGVTSESTVTEQNAASAGKSGTVSRKRKRGAVEVATQPAVAEPEVVADDAPLVEAKLLRAAKPVYPPNAMRSFITGDVRIAAEVGADGHVGKVAVISGPAALREAAVEAMKHYEYEPATKDGKAVASQVKVTIKFWFDP